MRIIWTNATKAQLERDMPRLLAMHKQALKEDPTWPFFGGILSIGAHRYQIA